MIEGWNADADELREADGDDELQDVEEVVYRLVRTYDVNDRLVEEEREGELTPEVWRRASRPWTYLDAMLAMGDSHYEIQGQSTTVQRSTGSDVHYGLGRLKARKPPLWKQATVTFTTSSAPYATWIARTTSSPWSSTAARRRSRASVRARD